MTIDEELDRISSANGGLLKPEDVVSFAKNPKTALHSRFDWNDKTAGHEWRLEQARRIIRFRMTFVDAGQKEPIRIRMYVSLPTDRQHGDGYRTTTDVMAMPELRRQLLESARNDMKMFKAKYRLLTELSDIFAAMDKRL